MPRAGNPKVSVLTPPVFSLAGGVGDRSAGTLYLQTALGGYRATLDSGFTVIFGRNKEAVHVCVGGADASVSRRHGTVRTDGRRWILRNEGRLPVELPGSVSLLSGHETDLPTGYTPLFIRTSPRRAHLIEAVVTPWPVAGEHGFGADATTQYGRLVLTSTDKRLLIVLGQHYLRRETHPQPLAWNQVAEELNEIGADGEWTPTRARRRVERLRERARQAGIAGLERDAVPGATGNSLNHNLIVALLESGTLVPRDLWEIGDAIDY